MSAFHPDGAYIDPPLHYECMRYAMQVCPYLAAPRYAGRVDDRTLKDDDRPTRSPSTLPNVFVAARPGKLVGLASLNVVPRRPYLRVE